MKPYVSFLSLFCSKRFVFHWAINSLQFCLEFILLIISIVIWRRQYTISLFEVKRVQCLNILELGVWMTKFVRVLSTFCYVVFVSDVLYTAYKSITSHVCLIFNPHGTVMILWAVIHLMWIGLCVHWRRWDSSMRGTTNKPISMWGLGLGVRAMWGDPYKGNRRPGAHWCGVVRQRHPIAC